MHSGLLPWAAVVASPCQALVQALSSFTRGRRRLLCPATPTALFARGSWTNPLSELFPLLFSSTEAPLQGTASRSAGDPGLHPRWVCVLLYSSLPSPAPAHLPRHAHLLPRKTLPALLCWGLCRAEPYRRHGLTGEGWSFLLWDQHSKHRPTLSREKWDQRAEFSLFEETKLPKSALYLCLCWIRRWCSPGREW